jgi:LmbE family N-acetylglucosaminyl deacetylase
VSSRVSAPSANGHGGVYRGVASLAHRVQPGILRTWRAAVVGAARDCTYEATRPGRSCLVVAPHPDDETLGCGATIARTVAAGGRVEVVIAADGRYSHKTSTTVTPEQMRALRRDEAHAACAALGVDARHVMQLGHEDTRLDRSWPELVDALRAAIARSDPDDVYVVSRLDPHPDHRTLNAALHHVLRTDARPRTVWEYPVWSWIDGPWFELSQRPPTSRALHLLGDPAAASLRAPRPRKVATGGFVAAKRAALAAYRSQMTNLTGEPDWPVMDDDLLGLFLGGYEVYLAPPRRAATTSP